MDTNNISSILDAISKANEAVKMVPTLEAQISDLIVKSEDDATTIAQLNDRINTQQGLLTERAETIARLEKELSEARFRESTAREASEKAIGTIRDMLEFGHAALPAAPAEVKEEVAAKVEPDKPEPEPAKPEPASQPLPYEGQPYSQKPFWMADSTWEHNGGLTQATCEKQGYSVSASVVLI